MSSEKETTGGKAATKLEPTNQSVFASLLQSPTTSTQPKGALISEIGGDATIIEPVPPLVQPVKAPSPPIPVDEGPSLMELMMEEQRKAAESKLKEQEKIHQEEAKKGFGGFKKGFFGGSDKKPASSGKTTSAPTSTKDKDIAVVKAAANKDSKPYVFDEVQQALEEDQSSMLKQLKTQEWITPDLTTQFQKNSILAKGFQDPKCVAAIQLMQKDPKQAMLRYKDDPEVGRFLQEFGKVMSAHFDALAAQQQPKKEEAQPVPIVEEIGPLQAQAIKNKSASTSSSAVPSSSNSSANAVKGSETDEEKRVQQILNDPELRTILMDAEFQKVLMECGDPVKLKKHMQNADIARKIRKMQQAGLVKIEL